MLVKFENTWQWELLNAISLNNVVNITYLLKYIMQSWKIHIHARNVSDKRWTWGTFKKQNNIHKYFKPGFVLIAAYLAAF